MTRSAVLLPLLPVGFRMGQLECNDEMEKFQCSEHLRAEGNWRFCHQRTLHDMLSIPRHTETAHKVWLCLLLTKCLKSARKNKILFKQGAWWEQEKGLIFYSKSITLFCPIQSQDLAVVFQTQSHRTGGSTNRFWHPIVNSWDLSVVYSMIDRIWIAQDPHISVALLIVLRAGVKKSLMLASFN